MVQDTGPELPARGRQPIQIRPIRRDDAPRLQALFSRLSPESIYLRFLSDRREITDEQAAHLATVDGRTRMAFVATRFEAGDEQIVGVARFDSSQAEPPGEPEMAVVVEDHLQNRGIGSALMQAMFEYARSQGIAALVGYAAGHNHHLLQFVRGLGWPMEVQLERGMWAIRVRLAEGPLTSGLGVAQPGV